MIGVEEPEDDILSYTRARYRNDKLPQWLLSAAAKAGKTIYGRPVEWNRLTCSYDLGPEPIGEQ